MDGIYGRFRDGVDNDRMLNRFVKGRDIQISVLDDFTIRNLTEGQLLPDEALLD